MYYSKYFDLEEFIDRETFHDIPEWKLWFAMDSRVLRIADILREELGPTTINNWKWGGNRQWSGFRPYGTPYYSQWSQHCFDDKTEILTNNGWRTYKTVSQDDLVLSYNVETGESEYCPIDNIVIQDYSGTMYKITTKHVNLMTTPNHRNLIISDRKDSYSFKYSEDIFNKRVHMLRSSNPSIRSGNLDDFTRLCIAVLADGSIHKSQNYVNFHLKKERKIERILSILHSLEEPYTLYEDKNKEDTVYISLKADLSKKIKNTLGNIKKFPKNWLKSFSREQLASVLHEYIFYDGHVPSREGDKWKLVSSINKDTIDTLSHICCLCGIPHSITKVFPNDNHKFDNAKPCYNLYISNILKNVTRVNKEAHEVVNYCGKIWCLNNKNTTLFVRREGKVVISGNSYGRATDSLFKQCTPRQARDAIKDMLAKGKFRGITKCITCEETKSYRDNGKSPLTWVHWDIRNNKPGYNEFYI